MCLYMPGYFRYVNTFCVLTQDIEVSDTDEVVEHAPEPEPAGFAVPGWDEPIYQDTDDPPDDILLGELVLMFFEWMHAHKVTDACAKSIYTLLSTLLPKNSNAGSWNTAKALLDSIYDRSVVAIEICPNDCIAFYDCKHPKVPTTTQPLLACHNIYHPNRPSCMST